MHCAVLCAIYVRGSFSALRRNTTLHIAHNTALYNECIHACSVVCNICARVILRPPQELSTHHASGDAHAPRTPGCEQHICMLGITHLPKGDAKGDGGPHPFLQHLCQPSHARTHAYNTHTHTHTHTHTQYVGASAPRCTNTATHAHTTHAHTTHLPKELQKEMVEERRVDGSSSPA